MHKILGSEGCFASTRKKLSLERALSLALELCVSRFVWRGEKSGIGQVVRGAGRLVTWPDCSSWASGSRFALLPGLAVLAFSFRIEGRCCEDCANLNSELSGLAPRGVLGLVPVADCMVPWWTLLSVRATITS